MFQQVKNINDELKLKSLSLGMSGDYLQALEVKSVFYKSWFKKYLESEISLKLQFLNFFHHFLLVF